MKSLSHVQLFATPWTIYIVSLSLYTHTHTPQPHTHLFFHSLVVGQVGCFPIFAVVNSAAMSLGECIFSNYSFIWIYAQEWDC